MRKLEWALREVADKAPTPSSSFSPSPTLTPAEQFQEHTRKRVKRILEQWQRLPEGPLVSHPLHASDVETSQEFSSPAYALVIRTGHELGYPKIWRAGDGLGTVRDDIIFLAQEYLRLTTPPGEEI